MISSAVTGRLLLTAFTQIPIINKKQLQAVNMVCDVHMGIAANMSV